MADQNYTSAEDLVDFDEMVTQDVVIPQWGDKRIALRPMTMQEATSLRTQASVGDKFQADLFYTAALSACAVRPTFTVDQARALWANKSAGSIKLVIDAIDRISGFVEEEQTKAEREFHAEPEPAQSLPDSGPLQGA